jgi:hypothetical protein
MRSILTRARRIRRHRCLDNLRKGTSPFGRIRVPALRSKYSGIRSRRNGGFSGSFSEVRSRSLRDCSRPKKRPRHSRRVWWNWRARLTWLAGQDDRWWMESRPFFDVERQRIWIFWRRVLHSAHHRTQLTAYLRRLGKPVVSTYGPTADVTWTGADPTLA